MDDNLNSMSTRCNLLMVLKEVKKDITTVFCLQQAPNKVQMISPYNYLVTIVSEREIKPKKIQISLENYTL